MIIRTTRHGLSAARANWKLIAMLWLLGAAVALTAIIPAWTALANAMGNLPLADPLARTLSFGILSDLAELHPGLLQGLASAGVASFALALFVGFAFAGGALEVLAGEGGGSFGERFGRGAFRHYGRFFRLGIATALLAALTAGIVAGPLLKLRGYVRREIGSEWVSLALLGAAIAAGALMVLLALLAQDAARVLIVRDHVRGVLRALGRGMALVWRHPIVWLGAWGINTILLLAAFALYLALAGALGRVALLGVAIALQQLFVAARCALRVALLGSECALVPIQPAADTVPRDGVAPPREEEEISRDVLESLPEEAVAPI